MSIGTIRSPWQTQSHTFIFEARQIPANCLLVGAVRFAEIQRVGV
jgi:hypothetical protein